MGPQLGHSSSSKALHGSTLPIFSRVLVLLQVSSTVPIKAYVINHLAQLWDRNSEKEVVFIRGYHYNATLQIVFQKGYGLAYQSSISAQFFSTIPYSLALTCAGAATCPAGLLKPANPIFRSCHSPSSPPACLEPSCPAKGSLLSWTSSLGGS